MKKIFILTGEPSGDKLASTVISKLKQNNSDIDYSCVGGVHLNSLGIKSIYDLKEVTYIGFTSVILNLLKIKKKINETADKIIEFKCVPPTQEYSISALFFFNLEITVEANLSPDGSPVSINIFFILL